MICLTIRITGRHMAHVCELHYTQYMHYEDHGTMELINNCFWGYIIWSSLDVSHNLLCKGSLWIPLRLQADAIIPISCVMDIILHNCCFSVWWSSLVLNGAYDNGNNDSDSEFGHGDGQGFWWCSYYILDNDRHECSPGLCSYTLQIKF